jgi:DNA-binding transcriptional MerR regulator
MNTGSMTIGQIADAAGLPRRTVRFYIQRGLLPAPTGRGRGSEYTGEHLTTLRRIQDLQAAGHSLDAVRKILAGESTPQCPVPPQPRAGRVRPPLSAGLWTRLQIAEGIEVHLDAGRYNPQVTELLAIRQCVRQILGLEPMADDDGKSTNSREGQ